MCVLFLVVSQQVLPASVPLAVRDSGHALLSVRSQGGTRVSTARGWPSLVPGGELA